VVLVFYRFGFGSFTSITGTQVMFGVRLLLTVTASIEGYVLAVTSHIDGAVRAHFFVAYEALKRKVFVYLLSLAALADSRHMLALVVLCAISTVFAL
jgi:hypothetical protein